MNLLSWLFKKKTGSPKDESETPKRTVQEIMQLLAPFKQTAYLPQTVVQEKRWSADSKMGGYPYLRHKNDWPICPNCRKNMQLFLQLNLEELPVNKEVGLIQLFYCTSTKPNCESDCEAFFPFSKSVVCRKIFVTDTCNMVHPEIEEIFEEKKIIGWQPVDDYPHFEEHQQLRIILNEEDWDTLEEAGIDLANQSDKLFGWPFWVQSVDYPFDRKTSSPMKLLFQIDSERNLPYMFGDAGIGHLTQSRDNPEELAFGWACY